MASRTKYTRRTTRDRLIDLLEEAIKLVKVRCVGPEEDVLEQARKEFQEAADMKNQAAELLKTVREETPYPQNQQTTNAFAEPKEPLQEPLQEPLRVVPQAVSTNPNFSVTRKKLPSCPGGPKAFNEFLKSKRAEVEANLGPNAKYADVRAEIAKRWKQACANTTKKVSKTKKTTVTPGRVNAPIPLTPAPEARELAELPEIAEVAEAPEYFESEENIEETPAPV